MRAVVAALGIASFILAAQQCGSSSGTAHTYVMRVYKVNGAYKIDVNGSLKTPANDRFELDFGRNITWEIDNQTGSALAFRIGDFELSSDGKCPVRFTFGGGGGGGSCSGEKLNIPHNQSPLPYIIATAEDMKEDDYYPNKDYYTFRFWVGPSATPNVPVDPELEIDREYGIKPGAIIAAVIGTGFLAWWWLLGRRRPSA